jgi:hypothetical protein
MAKVKKIRMVNSDPDNWNVNAPTADFIAKMDEGLKIGDIDSFEAIEPFVSLFPIRNEVYNSILESMKEKGFDKSQPLIIWREKNGILDGYTRRKAVKEAGISKVSFVSKSFPDEGTALDYVYRLQFSRRNIRDNEIIPLVKRELDRYAKQYGSGGKAEYLAQKFTGLSVGKAKKICVIIENGNEKQIEQIISEELTVNAAYIELTNIWHNNLSESPKSDAEENPTPIKKDKTTPKQKVRTNFLNKSKTVLNNNNASDSLTLKDGIKPEQEDTKNDTEPAADYTMNNEPETKEGNVKNNEETEPKLEGVILELRQDIWVETPNGYVKKNVPPPPEVYMDGLKVCVKSETGTKPLLIFYGNDDEQLINSVIGAVKIHFGMGL